MKISKKAYLNKKEGSIVVGNLTAGGDMALHEVLCDFYNIRQPETILLQSREYGRVSLKGDLVKVPAVKERLGKFVDLLIKGIAEKHTE